jgi:site-specific DNA-methyltransferase (adenine-specific)
MKTNVLYFGDNLEILRNREYFPDECIDLIYLDPPFNSKKDYNILFKENGGVESEAQIKAFTDTWHWTQMAEDTYHDIVTKGPLNVGKLIGALHDAIGGNDVMAYLAMMTARLIELHRVLKPTGSLYLHCDPTASHYLKLVLDQIFGPANFRNEIVWHFGGRGAKAISNQFSRNSNTILFYTKGDKAIFKKLYETVRIPVAEAKEYGLKKDENGRWFKTSPRGDYTDESIKRLEEEGRVYRTRSGNVRVKYFLGEQAGFILEDKLIGNVWNDIPDMMHAPKEYLHYETQKPLALLERIIQASSNEGDVVLDPFCGCGTAVVAAQKLNRRWLGIDITHLAINLMRNRLRDSFPGIQFEVIGEPKDLSGAKALALQKPDGRYQFQWWALGLIGARPLGEKKKGADKGIDGVIHFIDEAGGGVKRVIVQVKSGHVGVGAVQELKAVAASDAIGVFITLEPPTSPMKQAAVEAGYYHSPIWDKDYPKIQILTIEDLLKGKTVDMPPQTQTNVTFAKAQKIAQKEGEQLAME